MQPEEKLLGFDAREMWQEFHFTWTEDRKAQYLLRHDIKKPLSTDTAVWPTVFDVVGDLKPPAWRGALRLWSSLRAMVDFLKAQPITDHIHFWTIGVTLSANGQGRPPEMAGYPALPAIQPPTGSGRWTLLGYDIADRALLSGLSNCGYTEEERPEFQKQWGRHLNLYHLFGEERQADKFKKLCEQRFPAHAPFFVYGLYLIARGLRTQQARYGVW